MGCWQPHLLLGQLSGSGTVMLSVTSAATLGIPRHVPRKDHGTCLWVPHTAAFCPYHGLRRAARLWSDHGGGEQRTEQWSPAWEVSMCAESRDVAQQSQAVGSSHATKDLLNLDSETSGRGSAGCGTLTRFQTSTSTHGQEWVAGAHPGGQSQQGDAESSAVGVPVWREWQNASYP